MFCQSELGSKRIDHNCQNYKHLYYTNLLEILAYYRYGIHLQVKLNILTLMLSNVENVENVQIKRPFFPSADKI
ncbi:Uncharacterized protein TCM_020618 [Theobroma cacao]|uniref:Uncharacterized protein n=1 Tax=Theobroma cacao TaxID=3641 RepID=A0A061EMV2_THECC|nr:Uncharacterized protein TCM_020618 [Theobroma cacao]